MSANQKYDPRAKGLDGLLALGTGQVKKVDTTSGSFEDIGGGVVVDDVDVDEDPEAALAIKGDARSLLLNIKNGLQQFTGTRFESVDRLEVELHPDDFVNLDGALMKVGQRAAYIGSTFDEDAPPGGLTIFGIAVARNVNAPKGIVCVQPIGTFNAKGGGGIELWDSVDHALSMEDAKKRLAEIRDKAIKENIVTDPAKAAAIEQARKLSAQIMGDGWLPNPKQRECEECKGTGFVQSDAAIIDLNDAANRDPNDPLPPGKRCMKCGGAGVIVKGEEPIPVSGDFDAS